MVVHAAVYYSNANAAAVQPIVLPRNVRSDRCRSHCIKGRLVRAVRRYIRDIRMVLKEPEDYHGNAECSAVELVQFGLQLAALRAHHGEVARGKLLSELYDDVNCAIRIDWKISDICDNVLSMK